MKKIFVMLILFALPGVAQAATIYSVASDEATSSGSIVTGPGILDGIMLNTDGTNSVTVNIYDNTAASGTNLIPEDTVVTTSAANRATAISFVPPLRFNTGVYVEVTTSGTVGFIVYYGMR
jgi:hypothetical protein